MKNVTHDNRRMRLITILFLSAALPGCDHLSSDLGQSDDDIVSVTIPAQQPTADLGILTQLAVYSGSGAHARVDIEAGKANAGGGAQASLCLLVAKQISQVYSVNVSPNNGSALMRVSLLALPATDAGGECSGNMYKSIEVVIQRPATNPPVDGGAP
jgi:hypothetical protein